MKKRDKEEEERVDAKNELQGYVFNLRRRLSKKNSEEDQDVANVLEALYKETKQVILWLDKNVDDSNKEDYKRRQSSLKVNRLERFPHRYSHFCYV